MQIKKVGAIVVKSIASIVMFGTAWHATAQDAKAAYSNMAPLERYLIEDRGAEIALAQSAAPETISRDAEVLVLGRHGYETAIPGFADLRFQRHLGAPDYVPCSGATVVGRN